MSLNLGTLVMESRVNHPVFLVSPMFAFLVGVGIGIPDDTLERQLALLAGFVNVDRNGAWIEEGMFLCR
jgi:hypothetical protein